MGRKKSRFYNEELRIAHVDTNADIIDASIKSGSGVMPAKCDPLLDRKDRSAKRAQEFEKYVSKKLKKEERPDLFKRLQEVSFSSDKLCSTKNLALTDSRLKVGCRDAPKVVSSVVPLSGTSSFEQLHGSNPLKIFTKTSIPELKEDYAESDVEEAIQPVVLLKSTPNSAVVSNKKAFYILMNRSDEVEEARSLLPVYSEEQNIMEAIKCNPVTIICGETGSGKTTQVPQFLFEAGYGHPESDNPGMIGVTQPRRVAAINTAQRVQYELGTFSEDGKPYVGHQIRFDSAVGPMTRIKFITDGILLREISSDFLLSKYSVIIIDEAHERNLNTDILIGMLSRIVRLRCELAEAGKGKELRIVIMSATLNINDFMKTKLFDPLPPLIKVEARQHPVSTHFSRRTNMDHVAAAFKTICRIHSNLPPGGILVFLTGKQEIMELSKLLKKKYPGFADGKSVKPSCGDEAGIDENGDGFEAEEDTISDIEGPEHNEEDDFEGSEFELDSETTSPLHILPLHSLLSPEQQQKVFEAPPEGSRLCVLATNVAETSITIPNIKYVVDSGKVKQRVHNLETGTQHYEIVWCSKASAAQRAGRAGRTGPGHCYRLFSTAVFAQQFPEFAQPEIQRTPIESLILQLKTMGIDNTKNFPLPSEPEARAIDLAEQNLKRLQALLPVTDVSGQEHLKITKLGTLMSLVPLAPRWSRMLVLACQDYQDGVLKQSKSLSLMVALVACMAVGDPFMESMLGNEWVDEESKAEAGKISKSFFTGKPAVGDPLTTLSAFLAFMNMAINERDSFCRRAGLMKKKLEEIYMQSNQLRSILSQIFSAINVTELLSAIDRESRDYMRKALTESFADRIAERVKIPGVKSVLPSYRLLTPSTDPSNASDDHSGEGEQPIHMFLHSSSCLVSSPPRYLVFTESIKSEKGIFLKNATAVDQAWIPQGLLLN